MCPYMRYEGSKFPICKPTQDLCLLCVMGNSKLFNNLEVIRKRGNVALQEIYEGKDVE